MKIAKWAISPLVLVDVESTSTDVEEARVIEVCVATSTQTEFKAFTTLVNPGVEIPQDSIDVHHITNEMVEKDGKDPRSVIDGVNKFIAGKLKSGYSLVIMNAPYDLTVLDRESDRLRVPSIQGLVACDGPIRNVIDPFILDKKFTKYRKRVSETQGARCLKTICQSYGLVWDDEKAHAAEYDVRMTEKVVYKMAEVAGRDRQSLIAGGMFVNDASAITKTAAMSPRQLHDEQIKWAIEHGEDFRKYLIKISMDPKNKDESESIKTRAMELSTDWPIKPRSSDFLF